MDMQNMELTGGSLQISTEVLAKIARCAALEIDGVEDVSCGKQNKKVKDLLEVVNIQSPVTVEMHEGIAEVTVNVFIRKGIRIPSVAARIQENVKSTIQNMTNMAVSRVNLVVAGLVVPAQEKPAV